MMNKKTEQLEIFQFLKNYEEPAKVNEYNFYVEPIDKILNNQKGKTPEQTWNKIIKMRKQQKGNGNDIPCNFGVNEIEDMIIYGDNKLLRVLEDEELIEKQINFNSLSVMAPCLKKGYFYNINVNEVKEHTFHISVDCLNEAHTKTYNQKILDIIIKGSTPLTVLGNISSTFALQIQNVGNITNSIITLHSNFGNKANDCLGCYFTTDLNNKHYQKKWKEFKCLSCRQGGD